MSAPHTREFADVLAAERQRIEAHRRKRRAVDGDPLVGLALSGGGLRSTFFGLGVLQALDHHDLLRKVDYLSSVAGGGYIGASLTWFRRGGDAGFPFGVRGLGMRQPARDEQADPRSILGLLRQHGDHLTPAGSAPRSLSNPEPLRRWDSPRSAVLPLTYAGLVVRSVFLSAFVYGSLTVLLFVALQMADRLVRVFGPVLAGAYPTPTWMLAVTYLNSALLASIALLVLLALVWVLHPLASFVAGKVLARDERDARERTREYWRGLRSQRWTGRLLGLALATAVLGSVPLAVARLEAWLPDRWSISLLAIGAIAVGAALGVTIFRGQRRRRSEQGLLHWLAGARDTAAAVLMLYGLLTVSYVIVAVLLDSGALRTGLVVVLLAIAVAWLSDLNHLGISRTYRDRLMEAFLPGARAVARNQWQPALEANVAALSDMCGVDGPGPYHLLDAALVTAGSRRARFRSRGSDSFVLSPLYVGSDATGWRGTGGWMRGQLTLATAMAVSGPTALPSLAPGRPSARARLVSGALFALGLQLGYWAPNPDAGGRRERRRPSFIEPGVLRGILGRGLHEGARFVQLSDGSAFDVLGIYELVRRRVEVIVAADASQDRGYDFEALAGVATRVRTDFGVEIDFPDPVCGLDPLVPADSSERAQAERGFAVGRIRYPDATGAIDRIGVLIYLKATPVPGLRPEVVGYRGAHPDFPHESPPEAHFGEERVEAYRELGYRIAAAFGEENARREATSGGGWIRSPGARPGSPSGS